MRRIARAFLLLVSAAGAGCDLFKQTSPTTPTGSTSTLDPFVGTWTSSSTSSSAPATACSNLTYTITPVSPTAANVTFSATCVNNIQVNGTGTGTLNGSTLHWSAQGTVSQTQVGLSCPFSFPSNANNTAKLEDNGVRVTYSGTICGIGVSGSELLRKPSGTTTPAPAPAPAPTPTPTPTPTPAPAPAPSPAPAPTPTPAPAPSPSPSPSGNRTPDPPPGQRLPLPNMSHIVEEIARTYPNALRNSCQSQGGTWEFMDRLVDRLRQVDTRWGYNGKRGNANDPSHDVVDYHWGPGPDERSTDVYIIDVIGGHCGPNPTPAWIDVTQATADAGTIGRWISRGRF